MTRTRRFLGGVAAGYVSQVVTLLVGIWLTAFLLTRLGQDEYGLWLVATQLLGYLLLLDVGVVLLLPRDLAAASGSTGSERALREVFGETLRLMVWQTPVVLGIGGCVWIALPREWEALHAPLVLVLPAFVVLFPVRALGAALRGLQDLAFLSIAHTLNWLVGTAVTVALVLRGWGLMALATGWVTTQFLLGLVWAVRLLTAFPHAVPKHLPALSWERIRDRYGRGLWVSISQIAHVLVTGTHLLVIGRILGPAAVVPYFCTEKLVVVFGNQVGIVPQTAVPGLSQLRAAESVSRVTQATSALGQAVLMLSGAAACIIVAVNQGFVRWWVGAEQWGGTWLTVALLGAMLLRQWNSTSAYALFALGRERRLALTVLGDGVVSVALTIGLVIGIGPLGAAIGSLAGVVAVAAPFNLAALAAEMQTTPAALLRPLWAWFWRFAIGMAVAVGLASAWLPDTVARLVATTLLAAGVYAVLITPLVLRGPLAPYVRPHLEAVLRFLRRRHVTEPPE